MINLGNYPKKNGSGKINLRLFEHESDMIKPQSTNRRGGGRQRNIEDFRELYCKRKVEL